MNSAQRIFEILDSVPDVAERPDPIRIPSMQGHVELDNVTFGYEPNKDILENISLEIKPGEMLGVLGYSGAGKSTFVNLISRLYDVQEGCIKIDGVDVRDAKIADLRSQIGMVLQDTYLFAGSIAENVAYAKPEASMEEIIQACKVARAHDFIVKLPNGYETVIGYRGQNLSGGERQRISIARAILHNPRILILDEATASVDTETERGIQEGLERLVKGRTTIAIAHRLSTSSQRGGGRRRRR
jgi:ATP-binding cassette subfamily B protein